MALTSAPGGLPRWPVALAIVAHPDDESFGLGAVLTGFAANGTRVAVLCFTRGEASTLHGVEGDLGRVRAQELEAAAQQMGLAGVRLLDHPDGALAHEPLESLVTEALAYAAEVGATGLLAFDPSGITGHPDHQAATHVAEQVADQLRLPLLVWTLPDAVAARLREEFAAPFSGHPPEVVDVVLTVDRARQLKGIAQHASQVVPGTPLWRRLELLGDQEHLRWLRPPARPGPGHGTRS